VGNTDGVKARTVVNGQGAVLSPGFIDAHTHDDLAVIHSPGMLPKLSQGVTTVIVGNCGISAAPVQLKGDPPDPMNLLGEANQFRYPTFADYAAAVNAARPSVNVAALVGHTALRNNHMDRLDRPATPPEIAGMRTQLCEALMVGAIGLSTGLAYLSAFSATTEEVMELAQPLAEMGAIYATHMRSETESIIDAMNEAFRIAGHAGVPLVISHLKCAGIANWGRSCEVLSTLESAAAQQQVGCDCYPYAAGSSTLDLRQVDERVRVMITWSTPHPEMAGRDMADIAGTWGISQLEAAKRLQPAGAIYHSISEEDMQKILRHPKTMIGSDGLPNDPIPHPRLWGTFPRVLGHYSRDKKLFSLPEAVYKMTGLSARRFRLSDRGLIKEGYRADLVLFHPEAISDVATFSDPMRPAAGIEKVWVNGILSYTSNGPTGQRAGRFLRRSSAAVENAAVEN
jgi:N-acyl-D-amino-acid deacylase